MTTLSFYTVCAVALELRERGGQATVSELAPSLRRTPAQVGSLLVQTTEYGVTEQHDNVFALTPKGDGLAAAVEERKEAATTTAREAYAPYTDYVPKRWWPEKRA